MYVPASQLTQKTPSRLSSSNSSRADSWMVRIRSCRLTAEIKGGRWKSAPRSVSRAVLKARWPPFTASCRFSTHTYSFPALCWLFTSRVARSMHTIRQPVTFGSSVPEWPVFSTRRMRRIQATTSCEDGLAGLSRLITPYLYKVTPFNQSVLHPEGLGTLCGSQGRASMVKPLQGLACSVRYVRAACHNSTHSSAS